MASGSSWEAQICLQTQAECLEQEHLGNEVITSRTFISHTPSPSPGSAGRSLPSRAQGIKSAEHKDPHIMLKWAPSTPCRRQRTAKDLAVSKTKCAVASGRHSQNRPSLRALGQLSHWEQGDWTSAMYSFSAFAINSLKKIKNKKY